MRDLVFKIIGAMLESKISSPTVRDAIREAGKQVARQIPGDFAEDDIQEALQLFGEGLTEETKNNK